MAELSRMRSRPPPQTLYDSRREERYRTLEVSLYLLNSTKHLLEKDTNTQNPSRATSERRGIVCRPELRCSSRYLYKVNDHIRSCETI